MFSWKPMYQEIGVKILAYRDRQDELLAWLHEMKDAGIPVVKLDDENPKDTSVPLTEIDPFSFFANFNRAIKDTHRVRCLELLKDKMGLVAPVPTDFDGIPVVNLQKAMFFPFAYDRAEHMVPTLWDLAVEVVSKEPDGVSGELFSRCLDVPQVGLAKLTIGMFWMRPDLYLALDSLMTDYVKDNGVNVGKIKSYDKYRETVAEIESALGTDYPQISRDAYLFANKVPATTDALNAGLTRLLQAQAEKNDISVDQVVQQLAVSPDGGEKENEITNRLRTMPLLATVLSQKPFDLDALKGACKELWVLANGTDSIRRNAFLSSDVAIQAMEDLLDDGGGIDELARIDNFVEIATEHGYAAPNHTDAAGAAQFASALLSAVNPGRFADFRENRWNKLFSLITESNKRLCAGSSYGRKLIRAGKFAAALASTDTFTEHFGEEHGTWKAAGLAWCFKDGLFDMKETKSKQYWAGGFLWGGQGKESESHLDEFIEGNFWKTGYSRGGTDKKNTDHWEQFDQITMGDEFAIKGYGGRNDLKIYYVGTVTEIDPDEGVIRLEKLDRTLFHGKAPSAGGGSNWFGTIVPVVNPDAIWKVFHGEPDNVVEKLPDACLNTVLYGPPGTGKTYQSTHMAVELVEGDVDGQTPAQQQERFDALLDAGRIAFITFHQSFAYEDFVEGIRPVLEKDADDGTPRYECKDGVFKRIAVEALYAALERPESESREAEFEARWTELTNQIEETPDHEYEGLTEKTRYTLAVSPQGNITAHNLKNPDASFYTCGRRNMKKVFLAHHGKKEISIREINDTLGVGSHAHLATVVFHSLADIDTASPEKVAERPAVASYEERMQIVLEYLEHREETGYSLMAPGRAPRYVLVIDEINRGNISKILGELVTLLEPDKRIGAARQLRATLPYSGQVFGVPENLYIVGTMNTADKSIALVDVALRRRFEFEELMPDFSVCSLLPPEIRAVLTELNRRISLRKDRDHQIGHSYFMEVATAADFNRQFEKTTIPLLQEYFYNDWDGLRFVLGEEQKEDGVLIRSTKHGGSKWARNRWQWFSDVGVTAVDYLAVLKKNYGKQDGGQQDEG